MTNNKYVAAADFKANCLRLMDEVARQRRPTLLASRGRAALGRPLAQWITEAVSAPGLSIEPLLPQTAVEACSLPEAFHRDPADRLIVATARVANATLMTRDQRILDYAARGHLTAIAA